MLLLLHHQHLLDLLLVQLLCDHLLLRRIVFLFDLLATTFDLELTIIRLLFLIHDFAIILAFLLGGKHQELLLLLLSELLLLVIFLLIITICDIFVLLSVALLIAAVELRIDELLELLFGDLESVRVLFILLLEVGDELLPFILIEGIDIKLGLVLIIFVFFITLLRFIVLISFLLLLLGHGHSRQLGFLLKLVNLILIFILIFDLLLLLQLLLLILLLLLQILIGLFIFGGVILIKALSVANILFLLFILVIFVILLLHLLLQLLRALAR